MGGTIVDGTYNLVSSTGYGASCEVNTAPEQLTFVISGGATAAEFAISAVVKTGPTTAEHFLAHVSATLSSAADSLTLTPTCGSSGAPGTSGYTATSNSVTIITQNYGAGGAPYTSVTVYDLAN